MRPMNGTQHREMSDRETDVREIVSAKCFGFSNYSQKPPEGV
jgi:hypothetical protein